MLDTEYCSMSYQTNISLKTITMKGKCTQYYFLLLPNISHSSIARKDSTFSHSLFLPLSLSLLYAMYSFFSYVNHLTKNAILGFIK